MAVFYAVLFGITTSCEFRTVSTNCATFSTGYLSRTQDMAELIMAQSEIHRAEYLKLMHAYQFEHNHIKQYPALAQEDTQ